MQTILGAGGVIGKELAKSLPQYTNAIRLVSRNPVKVNDTDELFPADLLNAEAVMQAVAGSEIAYLVAGLPYNHKTWAEQWPVIMTNVIAACKAHHCKLVFFDNIYAYGPVDGVMTEDTPMNPSSKKGATRKEIVTMLVKEYESGALQALIARAPDFYGPATPLSLTTPMIFDRLKRGKTPQWLLNPELQHAFIYTPDAGRATALLGNTATAYNQVWHLPAPKEMITGKAFIEKAAAAYNAKPRFTALRKWMIRLGSLFSGIIKESMEMLYQYDRDYIFSSEKFSRAFPDFKVTGYDEGIKNTAAYYK